MNNQFDELVKGIARSVTRRAAVKKFGLGLAGMALACFGLADNAEARGCIPLWSGRCTSQADCCSGFCCLGHKVPHANTCVPDFNYCITF